MTRRVTVLGSTGVIGTLTLDVIAQHPESFQVEALCAGHNVELLAEQIRVHRPNFVSVATDEGAMRLRALVADIEPLEIGVGDEGLIAAAEIEAADLVVSAIVGAKGLLPTWAAIQRGARVALANKETLVAAGELVMQAVKDCGAQLLPVDSEHAALHQCLRAGRFGEIERLLVTASGGPFRTATMAEMETATVADALKHPTWSMGKKITIDSATMMNKGLEVIEAHHLFGITYDRIEVVVHPESIVHSMVEYVDGSVMAQLASHDMRLPIAYALFYPERAPMGNWPRLDWSKVQQLQFELPDFNRFPSLRLAFEAGKAGGYGRVCTQRSQRSCGC